MYVYRVGNTYYSRNGLDSAKKRSARAVEKGEERNRLKRIIVCLPVDRLAPRWVEAEVEGGK